MTMAGAAPASTGAAMHSVVAWAGAVAQAGMVGTIGVVITSADITAVMVTTFIVAVRAAPECIMAAGETMAEVITAVAMAAAIRPVHTRSE